MKVYHTSFPMIGKFKYFLSLLVLSITLLGVSSCSHDEDVRIPDDIVGIWSSSSTRYFEFNEDYSVRNLEIVSQDGATIGLITQDAYLYEPGYHIVIYLTGVKADVYQIVKLTSSELTWCWVEDVDTSDLSDKDNIGKVIGDIIKQAQEGFKLNPELYQTFRKISEDEYLKVLESLDYIW